MKRYISLVLAAVVLICSLAVPSYAAEVDFFNVLDYSTADGSGQNSIGSNGTKIATATYEIPFRPYIRYVDIVFTCASGNPDSVLFRSNELTLTYITTRTWRAFGEVSVTGSTFNLTFNSTISGVTYNILSFYVSTSAAPNFAINGTWDIHVHSAGATINYNVSTPDSNWTFFNESHTGDWDDSYFYSFLFAETWYKYDYIDFVLNLQNVSSINAISCVYNDSLVPLDISYLYPSDNHPMDINLVIRLDCRNLIRDSESYPEIIIDGNCTSNATNYFTVVSICGGLIYNAVEPNTFWLQSIFNTVKTGFNSVKTWISTQTNSITSSLGTLGSNIISSISTWGSNIVDALSPDTSDADSLVDITQQQAGQMNSNNNALQQLERPDLSSGNASGDISGIVSPSNTVKYTLFLTRIMNAPILSEVILLSMIFSLAAYVLFGKR